MERSLLSWPSSRTLLVLPFSPINILTMKFSVQIEMPLNGRAFGSGEPVRGRVELPADCCAAAAADGRVPDVAVVFQGTVRLTIVPQTSMDVVAQIPNAATQRTHTYTVGWPPPPPSPYLAPSFLFFQWWLLLMDG